MLWSGGGPPLGRGVAWLCPPCWAGAHKGLTLLPLISYTHALSLYDRSDFLGLNVARNLAVPASERWTPYPAQQPCWLLVATVLVAPFLVVPPLLVRCISHESR